MEEGIANRAELNAVGEVYRSQPQLCLWKKSNSDMETVQPYTILLQNGPQQAYLRGSLKVLQLFGLVHFYLWP